MLKTIYKYMTGCLLSAALMLTGFAAWAEPVTFYTTAAVPPSAEEEWVKLHAELVAHAQLRVADATARSDMRKDGQGYVLASVEEYDALSANT